MAGMRTTLGRVRGLGSAKEGVHHWWAQRLTALALIPLSIWFTASIISLAGAPYEAVAGFLGHPLNGTLMIALVLATFYHAALGLQVVIEDYVHDEAVKLAGIIVVKATLFLLGLATALGVLKLVLGR